MAHASEPEVTRTDLAIAKKMNAKLLSKGAWCQIHNRGYAMNHMVGARIEANECPRCASDREWLREAYRELAGSVDQTDPKKLIAHAERLAGYPLKRYAGSIWRDEETQP